MKIKVTSCLFMMVVILFGSSSMASSSDYFTAAVFEHVMQMKSATDTPRGTIISNLQHYEKAVTEAKKQGADLIVFPEYGIFSPMYKKNELKNFLERIPNPKEVRATPCNEVDQYSKRPVLFALSCMAKRSNIVVVANMGGREPCFGHPECPIDGEFHFNANVAFDQNGTLVGRYYKEHLFYELGMDVPKEKQHAVFETNFGKFAMFISFDILFEKMALVSRVTDVDAILFSASWSNVSPFYSPTQLWQAWAIGNNATMIVANMQIQDHFNTGSGIYKGRDGSLVSAFNTDGIPKLVIAKIPKRGRSISSTTKILAITENEVKEWNGNGKDLPRVCTIDNSVLPKNASNHKCFHENLANYTLVRLTEAEGHVEVCNGGLCCEVDYSADSMTESFYLGAFNGLHPFFWRYHFWDEDCFLARCDEINGTACSQFVIYSDTIFRRFSMKANITAKYVYPSVMLSGMGLVPVQNWTFASKTKEALIELNSNTGIRLLQATLKGRVHEKDPPYIR